jgi:DNA polymerase (family 10)
MENREVAEIFYEIAEVLGYRGETFKSRAYSRAARKLEQIDNLRAYYENDELETIPAIGKNLAKKIREYFETGSISYREKIKQDLPEGIEELLTVPGIGPKTALLLHKELGIQSLVDLERAIDAHEITKLKGKKTEENLKKGLELLKRTKKRIPINEAFTIVEELSSLFDECVVAGSFRRRKETVGDLDVLLATVNEDALKNFEILERGEKKITALYRNIQIDFRVVTPEERGSALQYFTGNKDHNIKLRRIAQKKGYKLNEYGLFKGNTRINTTEKDIYETLGMAWIPPELRENRGEIDAAQRGELPTLVTREDLRGDLHIHTVWSDGRNTIEDIVKKAKELNHEYIAITDHSPSVPVANGLSEEILLQQWEILESYDTVLKGVECDILKDGTLAYSDTTLAKADFVMASVHMFIPRTETLLKAMENEHVDAIGHPTGKFAGISEGYSLDMERLFEKAAETHTALEINAYRHDLGDLYVKKAKEYGVRFIISTDSHSVDAMESLIFGVYTARRGWVEKEDILNCLSVQELKHYVHRL